MQKPLKCSSALKSHYVKMSPLLNRTIPCMYSVLHLLAPAIKYLFLFQLLFLLGLQYQHEPGLHLDICATKGQSLETVFKES